MSDTDWWFLDLAAVIAITGALSFGLFADVGGVVRILIAMPLVLFLPGYALVAVLFPDDASGEYRPFDDEKTGLSNPLLVTGGLESIERFILSVVFSVSLVPGITLITTVTPGGIVLETVLSGIAIGTVFAALLAIVSRYRCPPERRYAPSLVPTSLLFTQNGPNAYNTTNPRLYNVAIVVGLVLLVASAGFALANPPEGEGFTEFAVETENVTGETETMYDSTYTAGETETIPVSITNQEGEERTYTTVALLEQVSDADEDATVEETEELQRESVTVPDGETTGQPLEVTPSMQGEDLRLTLLLYEDEAPEEPSSDDAYRTLHLPIEIE